MVETQVIVNECWRSVSGYINYQVSNIGRVRNCITGKILAQRLRPDGYKDLGLTNDDGKKTLRVHVLVANEFLEKPDTTETLVVDHIDRDKTNNQVNNLRWVTRSQNNMNSSKTTKFTSSRYKGVSYEKNKWRAYIRLNGKKLHLGMFETENEAAHAYNSAALELFGEFACLNVIED